MPSPRRKRRARQHGGGHDYDGRWKGEVDHGLHQTKQADGVIDIFQVPAHHSKTILLPLIGFVHEHSLDARRALLPRTAVSQKPALAEHQSSASCSRALDQSLYSSGAIAMGSLINFTFERQRGENSPTTVAARPALVHMSSGSPKVPRRLAAVS